MKKYFLALSVLVATCFSGSAQEVEFEEYDLENGMHVILHQDNSSPVVTTAVMYHVGSKHESKGRTGMAHFFEHLLFEGTENIPKGEWFNIVSSRGGRNNANTTQDRTYYYEVFPSNNLELGLWMESERLLHPVINQIGVDTQNEVVKEEKRQRIDNAPYGKISYGTGINPHMFTKHPYKNSVIGSMADLDAAQLSEFQAFNKKFYHPNNAVLVVTGDFEVKETKEMIENYFGTIPRGPEVDQSQPKEEAITAPIRITEYDANITLPFKLFAYRTPGMGHRDTYVLDMISTLLSDGRSSRMYKKMVDEQKMALQVAAFPRTMEDYGTYIIGAMPMQGFELDQLAKSMDEEIERIKTELISDREYEKLQNIMENRFVSANSSMEGIANSLARYYMLYDDVNLINNEIEIYRSITKEEIQAVAIKYLDPNKRLDMDYLPQQELEAAQSN